MDRSARLFVAGGRGMVGSAMISRLQVEGYTDIVAPTRIELDLTRQEAVEEWFRLFKPAKVVLVAAKVGGIAYNSRFPADFLYENLAIELNVLRAAADNNVDKLLFLGSSCIYPRLAPQPMKEEYLLTGPLEVTNEAYALGKIVGLKLCEYYQRQYHKRFISAMPTNLYGPRDNFNPEHSHVIPGLLRRFHLAKINDLEAVEIWGTGQARREFLFVEDLADALLILLENYDRPETINVGVGNDLSIRELAELIGRVVGYKGQIQFDQSKPDGTPQKLLDVSRMQSLGWQATTLLEKGLQTTYEWALRNNVFEG
jgi:GDP-L-fucose synthase